MRLTGLIAGLMLVMTLPAATHGADIKPGLYLRTTYAFGNLALSTVFIGDANQIAIDPKGGIDPYDFQASAKQFPAEVGTYRVDGDKITVAWANGKVSTLPVEFDNGEFSAYDGGLVTKAEAYPKNKTMTATFAGSAQTKNVSAAAELSLTADGKFTMERIGGIRGTPGETGIAESTTRGTYKLSGNTLILTAAGGKVTKHTVLPFSTAFDPAKAKISDEHMILDSSNFKREK